MGLTTENTVRGICLALPGVTERLSWGRPAWFARTLMARMWDDDVLTVKTAEREALLRPSRTSFYWTDYHDRSPMLVLVRLGRVDKVDLEELLQESYRIASG